MKKLLVVVYVAAFAALCACRCVIGELFIEPKSGFYVAGAVLPVVQNIILLVSTAFLALLPSYIFRYKDRYEVSGISRASNAVTMLFSLSLCAFTVMSIIADREKLEILDIMDFRVIVPFIFAAVASISLLTASLRATFGNRALGENTFAFTAAVIYFAVAATVYFIDAIAALTVSRQLFTLMFYLAAGLFMLGHFGICVGMDSGKSISYTVSGGLIGSVFAMLLLTDNVVAIINSDAATLRQIADTVLFSSVMLYEMYFSFLVLAKIEKYVRHIQES